MKTHPDDGGRAPRVDDRAGGRRTGRWSGRRRGDRADEDGADDRADDRADEDGADEVELNRYHRLHRQARIAMEKELSSAA